MRPTLLALLSLLSLLGVPACATTPAESTAKTAALAPAIEAFAGHGFWFGRSEHSPFGPMPYALSARRDGAQIVLRGDVPDGLGLPPGAYQQFTFGVDGAAAYLNFETSLTGEIVTGRMIEVARDAEEARFCVAPEGGGCPTMELRVKRQDGGLLFETRRNDAAHHKVVLQPSKG